MRILNIANGRSLSPVYGRYAVYSEPNGFGRRLGWVVPARRGWKVLRVSGSSRHGDYREIELGNVACPEDAAELFPRPHPIVSRIAEEFTNRWAGD